MKTKQYELPEEAAGLSVVLTVLYICKVTIQHMENRKRKINTKKKLN